jgi:hypothetical protein
MGYKSIPKAYKKLPVNNMKKYVVDTNIINWLVNGKLSLDDLPGDGEYVATHVQVDELKETKDAELREKLLCKFNEIISETILAETFCFNVKGAGLNQAKWSDDGGILYKRIKTDLDNKKPRKNNWEDAVIAEVAEGVNLTV